MSTLTGMEDTVELGRTVVMLERESDTLPEELPPETVLVELVETVEPVEEVEPEF